MAKKMTLKCKGKKLEITPVLVETPENPVSTSTSITPPGKGEIEISAPLLSAYSITIDQSVSCQVQVKGKNVAFIYSELLVQIGDNLIGPIQRDFLHSPEEREVKGIQHPHWTASNDLKFEITPRFNLLYCGKSFTLACVTPLHYGASADNQIRSLEGIYQRGGGEPFRARMEFDAQGNLLRKIGFYPSSQKGLVSPFELLIEDGDTFEPYVTLLSADGIENLATVKPVLLGGGNTLKLQPVEATPGVYQVGVLVEDFDGKFTRGYSPVSVSK